MGLEDLGGGWLAAAADQFGGAKRGLYAPTIEGTPKKEPDEEEKGAYSRAACAKRLPTEACCCCASGRAVGVGLRCREETPNGKCG